MKYSAYTMIMPEFTTISECAQVLKGIGYDGIELWLVIQKNCLRRGLMPANGGGLMLDI